MSGQHYYEIKTHRIALEDSLYRSLYVDMKHGVMRRFEDAVSSGTMLEYTITTAIMNEMYEDWL